MVKTGVFVSRFNLMRRGHPMIAGNVQQSECSQNVGFDKSLWAADGIVNMAFGGKVNYAFDVIFTEQFSTNARSQISP